MNEELYREVIDGKGLMYRYIRGSHLYGLNNEDSDIDTGGIYIAPQEELLGLGLHYHDEIGDTKNDNKLFEVGRFVQLARTSNPTVLEALFVPRDKMIVPPCDALLPLFEIRDKLVTKQCFMPFIGYAVQQIKKARGLKKKIVNPITKRMNAYDFAFTFYNQGSTPIKSWLDYRGLDMAFCGLTRVPNMHDTYGVYYDWGAHFLQYGIESADSLLAPLNDGNEIIEKNRDYILSLIGSNSIENWFHKNNHIRHYRGLCLEGATDLRCSSIEKDERPLCNIVFNESGFTDHCKKYKEYKEWEQNRNPKRYESSLNKSYDSKNMMHCFRLMHMGKEIAEGKGINLERTWDKELLMNIRNHKYEYDELMEMVTAEKASLDEAIEMSTIAEKIDSELLNATLIEVRNKWYNNN